jgi:F0F1-type ATP synthase delta subunit
MYSELLSTLTTSRDVALLRQEIQALQTSLFKVKGETFEKVLKTQVRASVAEWISTTLEKYEGKKEKFLEDLLKEIEALPMIQVEIAFEPSQEALEQIHAWAVEQVGQNALIDVSIQPDLLGGATISYQGKYFDGSLKENLQELISGAIKKYIQT